MGRTQGASVLQTIRQQQGDIHHASFSEYCCQGCSSRRVQCSARARRHCSGSAHSANGGACPALPKRSLADVRQAASNPRPETDPEVEIAAKPTPAAACMKGCMPAPVASQVLHTAPVRTKARCRSAKHLSMNPGIGPRSPSKAQACPVRFPPFCRLKPRAGLCRAPTSHDFAPKCVGQARPQSALGQAQPQSGRAGAAARALGTARSCAVPMFACSAADNLSPSACLRGPASRPPFAKC